MRTSDAGPPSRRVTALFAVALLATACGVVAAPVGDDPVSAETDRAPLDDEHDAAPGGDADEADERDPAGDEDADAADRAANAEQVGANELGAIPILMYHRVIEDPGPYDLTPEQFRGELEHLFDSGYYPVRVVDVIDRRIDVPAGRSPVVLTFDDSSPSQFRFLEDGRLDPESAVGILIDVARSSGVPPTGTFLVLDEPFATTGELARERLRRLSRLGFELGNHTVGHVNLRELDDDEVQREIALGAQLIREAIPSARVASFAPPFGVFPENRDLVVEGSYGEISYRHEAVLRVGAGPAPSPFSVDFDPVAVPRIFPQPDFEADDAPDLGSGYWLWRLEEEPGTRYVSDGDASTVAFPEDLADRLDARFADRAVAY